MSTAPTTTGSGGSGATAELQLFHLIGYTALPHHRNYLRHLAPDDGKQFGVTRLITTLCGQRIHAIGSTAGSRRECERCHRIADRNYTLEARRGI